jgi:hypothetical protein
MKTFYIKVMGYICYRCEHRWIPKNHKKPKYCPGCHSPYWYKKRERKDLIEKYLKP